MNPEDLNDHGGYVYKVGDPKGQLSWIMPSISVGLTGFMVRISN
jgi:hypothetical protein